MLHFCRPSRGHHLLSFQAGPHADCGRLRQLPYFRNLHGHGHLEESQCYVGLSGLPRNGAFSRAQCPRDGSTTERSCGVHVSGTKAVHVWPQTNHVSLVLLLVV